MTSASHAKSKPTLVPVTNSPEDAADSLAGEKQASQDGAANVERGRRRVAVPVPLETFHDDGARPNVEQGGVQVLAHVSIYRLDKLYQGSL